MAIAEVVRDWIFKFDTQYITRFEHRLTDNALSCRSCGVDFEVDDVVHAQYKSRGPATKRHLVCAIFHKVTTITEAKQIAPKDLQIDWHDVSAQVSERMQQRKVLMASWLYWMMAAGFTAFFVNNQIFL